MKHLFLIAFWTCNIYFSSGQQDNIQLPERKHAFTVIAHRGYHEKVPENTLAAIKQAIKIGADYTELDLRMTKDSVLVVMHDATLDRMTNGKGKLNEFTFAELKKIKIIDKNSKKSYSIPTFDQVLRACKNRIYIYLDFKQADVKKTYRMIQHFGMEHQFIVYINSMQQYIEWTKVSPGSPLMVSLPDAVHSSDALRSFIKTTPMALLDGNYNEYTQEMVSIAEASGIPVWPDIQGLGEEKNWDQAIAIGLKGLQTDHPAQLIEYLQKNGIR